MMRRRILLAVAASALVFGVNGAFAADQFPSKPVNIVVPFPPGSPVDLLARAVGQRLSSSWNQPVVVENRPGTSGLVGSDYVARSSPDGYTLLHAVAGTVIAAHVADKPPVYPDRDLTPIALVGETGLVMAANQKITARDPAAFVNLVKAEPGKYFYASYGNGSVGHLYGYIFNKQLNLDMEHVPYKGEALALNDLIGGQVPVAMLTGSTAAPHIASGAIHALAATGARRSPLLPNVPTFSELGYTGMDDYGWYGFFGPASMPADLTKKISSAIAEALEDSQIKDQFSSRGVEIRYLDQDDFAALVAKDSAKWKAVVEEIGVRQQ